MVISPPRLNDRGLAVLLRTFGVLVVLGLGSLPTARADDSVSFSPKFSLRTSNGLLQNVGTQGGSATDFGGLNLLFNYYLSSKVSVGIGYQVSLDFTTGSVPLNGFDFPFRYYFSGKGTYVDAKTTELTAKGISPFGFYGGAQLSQRNYFVGNSLTTGIPTPQSTGTFLASDLLLGGDYRVSRHFEVTGEGSFGVFSFALTDSQYALRGYMFLLGVSYVW